MKLCSIDGCGKRHTAKGFCDSHYRASRLYGDPLALRPYAFGRKCSVDGCEEPHASRGWCRKHLKRWEKTGDVNRARDGKGRPPSPPCGFPGCRTPSTARDLCARHLKSVYAHGHELATASSKNHPASPAVWSDLRRAHTMRELGRRKDVDFYLERAETHGRPLTPLEREYADGVRMEANRERDQAVLADDVKELTSRGLSAEEVGSMIGVSDRTVVRKRVELGIAQPTGHNQHKE